MFQHYLMESERMSLSKLKTKTFYNLYHSIKKRKFLESRRITRVQELMNRIQERKFDDETGEFRIKSYYNHNLDLELKQVKSIHIEKVYDDDNPSQIILKSLKIEFKQSLKRLNLINVKILNIKVLEN